MDTDQLIIIGFGIVMIIFGAVYIWHSEMVKGKCTRQTDALIISVKQAVSKDPNNKGRHIIRYTPVYSYDADGVLVTVEGYQKSSNMAAFLVGAMVKVRYDPSKPNTFVIVGDYGKIITGAMAVVVGVAAIIVGLIY